MTEPAARRPALAEPIPGEPWEELLEFFRQKLAEAERGELAAFAYVVEYARGDCYTHAFHNAGSNAFKMVGMIEELKVRIAVRHLRAFEIEAE